MRMSQMCPKTSKRINIVLEAPTRTRRLELTILVFPPSLYLTCHLDSNRKSCPRHGQMALDEGQGNEERFSDTGGTLMASEEVCLVSPCDAPAIPQGSTCAMTSLRIIYRIRSGCE